MVVLAVLSLKLNISAGNEFGGTVFRTLLYKMVEISKVEICERVAI